MMDELMIDNTLNYVRLGWLRVVEVDRWESTPELLEWSRQETQVAMQSERLLLQESRREAVRGMLRKGGYKPSGRNKPAQEYLQRCLREGDGLPVILPAVDVLNTLSVSFGLPISMLGTRYFPEGVAIRLGAAGESFVFNSGGQALEVEGLVVCCGGVGRRVPLGSPVKDSMAGKIGPEDRDLICLIYGPSETISESEMGRMTQDLAKNLEKWTGGKLISLGTA